MIKNKNPKKNKEIIIFEEKEVRRIWKDEQWYLSVIDVIEILSQSPNPRRYWSDLKRKLATEGYSQLYENIVQLKMLSADAVRQIFKIVEKNYKKVV